MDYIFKLLLYLYLLYGDKALHFVKRIYRQTKGQMNKQIDGQNVGQIDGWMDRQIEREKDK